MLTTGRLIPSEVSTIGLCFRSGIRFFTKNPGSFRISGPDPQLHGNRPCFCLKTLMEPGLSSLYPHALHDFLRVRSQSLLRIPFTFSDRNGDTMRHPLIIPACLILALILFPFPVNAEGPTVLVADYTVTPAVLQPGDVGTITAIIRNTASSASIRENTGIQTGGTFESSKSTDIGVNIESVQIDSKDVEVLSGNYKRIGSIGPGQSIPITFLIRAPAKDGIYFPEIWIDVTGGQSVRQPVPVNVNTQIALLKKPALTVLKTVPDGANPGDEIATRVVLRNDGLSRADQIRVMINSTTASITPKTPGTYHIDHLLKGENATLDMVFFSDKKAPIGLNQVLLTLTYANADGTVNTQTETLGIRMKGSAKIGIASLSTDPVRIKRGDPVSLVIRLENTGTDNANSVKASVDIPMAGSHDAYVGTIEPDTDAPAVFSLQAKNPETYTYNLTVQYEDDYGIRTQNETLRMTVLDGDPTVLVIAGLVFAAVVAGAGYWFFIRQRKDMTNA